MSPVIEIRLTNRELAMGAECGIMRNIASLQNGSHDAHGFMEESGWNAHIEGACGEIAAAKVMGRFWSPTVNTFHAPDLGHRIQVRTRSRHGYELYVRPNDNIDHLFVLVTGRAPNFAVRGYLAAYEARRTEWLKMHGDRPAAWFIPTAALLDIGHLCLSPQ